MELALVIIETAGAIGVILTLIYLSKQVRDNTRISAAATRQSISETLLSNSNSFFSDSDFRKIFKKHLNNEALNAEELIYIETFGYSSFRNFENIHSQYKMKMLSKEDWETFRKNLKALCQTPALKNFWNRESENFNQSFFKEVQQILKELKTEPPLMPEALFQPKKNSKEDE